MSHSSEAAARMSRGGLERERERVARVSLSLSLSWHPPGTMACSLVHVQVGVGVGGQRLSTSTIVSGPVPRVGTRGYTWVHVGTQVLDTWDNAARTQRSHHRHRHDRTVSSPWTMDSGPWLVPCHNIQHTRASSGLREADAEAGKRAEPGEAEVLKASCLVLSPPPPENVKFHTVSPPAPVARHVFQKVRDHTHLP